MQQNYIREASPQDVHSYIKEEKKNVRKIHYKGSKEEHLHGCLMKLHVYS
jgi:hypothetical protein